jgi:putative transposase
LLVFDSSLRISWEVQYGCGYVGLIPKTSKRGNRTPRSDAAARELLEKAIKQEYAAPQRRKKIAVYQAYEQACERRGVAPLTLHTFYRHLKSTTTTEIETQRLGTRAIYPEHLPYPYLEYHTPVHGDHPFAIVHIDHTPLDIELVAQASGRNLGHPWATLYVKLKASPLDRGPEQAVHLFKESLHTPGKGLDLHTA